MIPFQMGKGQSVKFSSWEKDIETNPQLKLQVTEHPTEQKKKHITSKYHILPSMVLLQTSLNWSSCT